MQASISPKKYIETRIRNLPIYKCFVNADWETSSMANVIVMRQHVNGNVSGGIYLVDLLCLGVKKTIWFFNEDESETMARFEDGGSLKLETIDYALAHNIIYAGHDFAMDYGIQPHPEFTTSRFVLEEDDDTIPLVDVQTGYGEDGIPHLMANQHGQYADALLKLKKNAGEGNYLYTVDLDDTENYHDFDKNAELQDDAGDEGLEDDMQDNGLEENIDALTDFSNFEEEETRALSDFPDGELTLENVQEVLTADLADEDKVGERNTMDKMICLTEMMLRILPDNFYAEQQEWADAEWDELKNTAELPNGITNDEFEEWKKIIESGNTSNEENDDDESVMQQLSGEMATKFSHNPFVTTMLIADSIFSEDGKAKDLLALWQPQHGHLPLFQLLMAFCELLKNEPNESSINITGNNIGDAFPAVEHFNELEFALFHALKCIENCRLQMLPKAVQHYYLAAATGIVHILFMPMMDELLPLLQAKALEQFTDKDCETD